MFNILYAFLKEISGEKTRFFLAILAIAWGTASIASMLAIGEGLRLTFGRTMSSTGKALLYVSPGQTTTAYGGQAINQAVIFTPEDLHNLKSIPHIQHLMPEYEYSTSLSYGDHQSHTSLRGVDPLYGQLRYIIPRISGRFIMPIDSHLRSRVIVLGNQLAHELAPHVNLTGKFIRIDNQQFQVIGIMKKKLQWWMYGMPDSHLAWIPASTYIGLFQPKSIDRFIVSPDDPQQLSLIKKNILQYIAIKYHFDPQDKNLVNFTDSYKIQEKTHQLFTGMEIFLGIIGGINLIIAGTGLANVMFMSVHRATREIGIRMAIGAKMQHILFQYLLEALVITLIGGMLGLLAAFSFTSGISDLSAQQQFFKSLGSPKPVLSFLVITIVMSFLGLTGILAGFFPAKKAASIHPAEALRHE